MTSYEYDRLIENVKNLIQLLKTALLKQDATQADRVSHQLEMELFQDNIYLTIFDEEVLASALNVLRQYGENEPDGDLTLLQQHLSIVHSVHYKLHSVSNPHVSIETLLYEILNRWPQINEPIECAFDSAAEEVLKKIRLQGPKAEMLESFFKEYYSHLQENGYDSIVNLIRDPVKLAITAFRRLSKSTLRGLFLIYGHGEVCGINIKVSPTRLPLFSSEFNHEVDHEMINVDKRARSCAADINRVVDEYKYEVEISRHDLGYGGSSIGLALGIGYLAEAENFPISPYIAFTGDLEFKTRKVTSVNGIYEKVLAAKEAGIFEVFLPEPDISSLVPNIDGIQITPVNTLEQAWSEIRNRVYEKAEPSLEARICKLQLLLKKDGISFINRENFPNRIRLIFYNREKITVDVYLTHKVAVGGSPKSTLRELIQTRVDEVFGHESVNQFTEQNYTYQSKNWSIEVPTPELRQRIREYFGSLDGVSFGAEAYCEYTAKITQGQQKLQIKQYTSSKLLLQGKDDILFASIQEKIENILGIVKLQIEDSSVKIPAANKLLEQQAAVRAVDLGEEWVGTDESGKGDYFGPLVSAAVYVNRQLATKLEDMGVVDSKNLADKRILAIAPQIERLCGKRCIHVIVNPEKYNQLYEQFKQEGKNLNSLLAWTHTRALENILPSFRPHSPLTVLIDKFADEKYIQDRFKKEKLLPKVQHVELRLIQLPKAETNIAVAAASILARYYFLQQLDRLSSKYGVEIPKGSSNPNIVILGKKIVLEFGRDELAKVAKLHFSTTRRILE